MKKGNTIRNFLIIILTVINVLYFPFVSISQKNEVGYVKYDNQIVNPFINASHEISFNTLFTMDYEPSSSLPGNFSTGIYYGFGLGYNYRLFLHDGKPEIQSASIGVKAEYIPGYFYKFNLGLELDLLALGFSRDYYISFLSSFDNTFIFSQDFSRKEMAGIIYFVKLNMMKLELKWGLQFENERFMPDNDLDETMNVFKLSYLLFRK